MHKNDPHTFAQQVLALADVHVARNQPGDIQVHTDALYARVIDEGSLGLGESYMDGWWDCDSLDEFFYKVLSAQLDQKIPKNFSNLLHYLQAKIMNLQSKERAFQVGQKHYDLGDNLFTHMLDKNMIYSCAYWKNADTLDQAQLNKLELICKKLQLKPGMKVLDIGCGWGGLARYMAKEYGVRVVGITISKEQANYARHWCQGLPIEIRLEDYRDLNELFDRIVSVGMFEHVGTKNYTTFMEIAHRCLTDDGLFLLHTIGGNTTSLVPDPWISKYIFPNGILPSIAQIGSAIEDLFIMEDWHNFGADYDKTLMAWHTNFTSNWNTIKKDYDDRFYRMWNYYLLSCAGLFRSRGIQLWQIVLSKKGMKGGYNSIR